MTPCDWLSLNAAALRYGILDADPGTPEGKRKMIFYIDAFEELVDLALESAGYLERCKTELVDMVAGDCAEAAQQSGFPAMDRDGLD